MLELQITPATILIGLAIIALVVLAIRRLTRKGMCDCKECVNQDQGCPSCGAVDKMLADMEKAAKDH